MKCPYCGKEIREDAIVCQFCGRAVLSIKSFQEGKKDVKDSPSRNSISASTTSAVTETNLIARIRNNYSLLLFLVTTSIPLVFWWLLMLLGILVGNIFFIDPNKSGMDLFMIFIFPLIAAPTVSGLSLLITHICGIKNIGCWVFVLLGFVIPLIAFALVFVAIVITSMLYTGDEKNMFK